MTTISDGKRLLGQVNFLTSTLASILLGCRLNHLFSRLTVGVFIPDKKPSTVGEKLMEKWIAPMGRMEMIHSDHGGEFCCDELVSIAEYLGVKSSFTAARSPNQNGLNERNHAIVDNMISKMRTADPNLSAEVALTWALVAKNTLQNVSGYSPFQIVFGHSH